MSRCQCESEGFHSRVYVRQDYPWNVALVLLQDCPSSADARMLSDRLFWPAPLNAASPLCGAAPSSDALAHAQVEKSPARRPEWVQLQQAALVAESCSLQSLQRMASFWDPVATWRRAVHECLDHTTP